MTTFAVVLDLERQKNDSVRKNRQIQQGCVSGVGCAPITAMWFWSISYIKVVSDHSNFKFPVNPFNWKGWNNAQYHDVHHSARGLRLNYCQPWFTYWDRIYGCYHDPLSKEPLPIKKSL